MVDAFRVKNLRSIHDSGWIPIKKVTMLVGANASGKSTLLRTLPLLRQSVETNTRSPILWFGPYVDFGTADTARRKNCPTTEPIELCFRIKIQQRFSKELLSSLSAGLRIATYFPGEDIGVDVAIALTPGPDRERTRTILHGVSMALDTGDVIDLKFDERGNLASFWVNGLDVLAVDKTLCRTRISHLIPNIVFGDEFGLTFERRNNALKEQYTFQSFVRGSSPTAIVLRGAEETSSVISTVGHLIKKLVKYFDDAEVSQYVENFPVASKTAFFSSIAKSENLVGKGDPVWDAIFAGKKSTDADIEMMRLFTLARHVPALLRSADFIIAQTFSMVSYLAPLRAQGSRYYRVQDLGVHEIDHVGENLPMVLASLSGRERRLFSEWVRSSLGFNVEVGLAEGHVTLNVKEPGSPSVNIADTGFGYSQILPLAAQIWLTSLRPGLGRTTRILAVEQPELHLHPRLQCNIATMIANATASSSGPEVRFLLETHSEALVNQFGLLISEGIISHNDVQIVTTGREEGQTLTKLVGYDEGGSLIDWPYGFLSSFGTDNDH